MWWVLRGVSVVDVDIGDGGGGVLDVDRGGGVVK